MTSGVEFLAGNVDAGRGIGGARAAGDETNAGTAGRLAHGLGHHRRPTFLPAYGDGNVTVAKRIDGGEITFARYAEHMLDAVNAQLIDQNLCRRTVVVLTAHRFLPIRRSRLAAPGVVNSDCRDLHL